MPSNNANEAEQSQKYKNRDPSSNNISYIDFKLLIEAKELEIRTKILKARQNSLEQLENLRNKLKNEYQKKLLQAKEKHEQKINEATEHFHVYLKNIDKEQREVINLLKLRFDAIKSEGVDYCLERTLPKEY